MHGVVARSSLIPHPFTKERAMIHLHTRREHHHRHLLLFPHFLMIFSHTRATSPTWLPEETVSLGSMCIETYTSVRVQNLSCWVGFM